MKRNNLNFVLLFAVMALPVIFLFAGRADAQVELPLDSPREACQYYQSRWEQGLISVVKDTQNECLVRVGDGNTGYGYIRAYYSGNKFCLDSYGAYFNNAGLADSSECITVSQQQQQQQQQTMPSGIVTPLPILENLKSFLNELSPKIVVFFQTSSTLNKIIIGVAVLLFILILLARRKKISRRKEKEPFPAAAPLTEEKRGEADREGLAVVSFFLGILTLLTSQSSFLAFLKSISFLNYLLFSSGDYRIFFFLMGIIGLILGIIGLKRSKKKIFVILGIILNIIGILLWWGAGAIIQ